MNTGDIFFAFMGNLDVYAPISFSFVMVMLLAGVSFFLKSEQFRIVLLLPLALFFLLMSFTEGDFPQEFYLNMSTELFGALITLFLFATFVTTDSWTFPVIIIVIMMMLGFVFTIDTNDFHNGISLNMSTELMGAMLTTVWLRRDWIWGNAETNSFILNRQHQRQRRKNLNEFDTTLDILVSANNQTELEYKITLLEQQHISIQEIGTIQRNNRQGGVFCIVKARILTASSEDDLLLMPTDEVRVRLIGSPDATKRAYDRIKGIFACKEQTRLDSVQKELLHLQFQVETRNA